MLTNSVGKTGQNKTHDVAVVQTLLKNANRGKHSKVGKSYWPGIIDGKHTSALCNALSEFQAEHGIPLNGNCPSMGKMVNALKAAVKPNYKTIQALPGTIIVYSSPKTSEEAKKNALAYLKPATLPTAEKNDLQNLVSKIADNHNICLVARDPYLLKSAHIQVCLEIDGISCINNQTGQFLNFNSYPDEMKAFIEGQLGDHWQMVQDSVLTINSKKTILGRTKATYPDSDNFKNWGVTFNDEVAVYLAGFIHEIIKEYTFNVVKQKNELDPILQIIRNGSDVTANKILKITETCSQPRVNILNINKDIEAIRVVLKGIHAERDKYRLESKVSNYFTSLNTFIEGLGVIVDSVKKNPISKIAGRATFVLTLNELYNAYHEDMRKLGGFIEEIDYQLDQINIQKTNLAENYETLRTFLG